METLDKEILDIFIASRTNHLSPFMFLFSYLVEIKIVISIIIGLSLYFWLKKETRNIFILITTVGLSITTTIILKNIFDRARPLVEALTIEKSFAFPSAHSALAASLYGFIIFWIVKKRIRFKKILISLLTLIILMVGISRLYLGVHYLSDVLVGYLVGFSSLLVALGVSRLDFSLLLGGKRR